MLWLSTTRLLDRFASSWVCVMEILTAAILASLIVPGLIAGFVHGRSKGYVTAMLSLVSGGIGGLAGATLLSGLLGSLGLSGQVITPIVQVAGSVAGAMAILWIADTINDVAERKAL